MSFAQWRQLIYKHFEPGEETLGGKKYWQPTGCMFFFDQRSSQDKHTSDSDSIATAENGSSLPQRESHEQGESDIFPLYKRKKMAEN